MDNMQAQVQAARDQLAARLAQSEKNVDTARTEWTSTWEHGRAHAFMTAVQLLDGILGESAPAARETREIILTCPLPAATDRDSLKGALLDTADDPDMNSIFPSVNDGWEPTLDSPHTVRVVQVWDYGAAELRVQGIFEFVRTTGHGGTDE